MGDLRYEDVSEPSPGPGQVKVKISYAGICGSDLHEYADGPHLIGEYKTPVTLGHEFAGRIVELGEGVTDFKAGDRVTGLLYWACGKCHFCMRDKYSLCSNKDYLGASVNGCMAEYMVASGLSLYKIPDSVSDELGALVEPLSVAMHAVYRGNIHLGDTAAIVGDGPIGLSTLLAAKAAGASEVYIVSKHKSRGNIASIMGATAIINPNNEDPIQAVKNLTGGLGVDVSLDCAGSLDTSEMSVDLARQGGTTVIVGAIDEPIPFHFHELITNEKTIVGSNIYIHEFGATLGLLADKRIDPSRLITAKIPLKDAVEKGIKALLTNKDENLKILLIC